MKLCRFIRLGLSLMAFTLILIPTRMVLADGSHEGLEKEVNGYKVQLSLEGQAETGKNKLQIRISDPGGQPVGGATVFVNAVLAAEGHSEPHAETHMEAESDHSEPHVETHSEADSDHSEQPGVQVHGETESHAELDNEDHAEQSGGHGEVADVLFKENGGVGLYTGKVTFEEPGDWLVRVRFTTDEGAVEESVEFPVDVMDAGPDWAVLGGFFGLNLAIVAAAAVMKPKPVAAKPEKP